MANNGEEGQENLPGQLLLQPEFLCDHAVECVKKLNSRFLTYTPSLEKTKHGHHPSNEPQGERRQYYAASRQEAGHSHNPLNHRQNEYQQGYAEFAPQPSSEIIGRLNYFGRFSTSDKEFGERHSNLRRCVLCRKDQDKNQFKPMYGSRECTTCEACREKLKQQKFDRERKKYRNLVGYEP